MEARPLNKTFWRSFLCILISFTLILSPVLAVFPPNNASWTIHRGIPENQGINPNSSSPATDHELWNDSSLTNQDYTCDPVVANVTTSLLGPSLENLVYTGHVDRVDVWDAWNGTLEYYLDDTTLGEVNQIIVDDPFVLIKTPTELRAYDTTLVSMYWSYTNVTYLYGAHVGQRAGHFTDGLNRLQLVQHQVISGVINGSDSNYTGEENYPLHRAFRADYDTTQLSCIWHRDLVEEVWGTPAMYLNDTASSEWGGNNTTSGYGHDLPGYGQETPIPPEGTAFDVANKNMIFLTRDNWVYCLRADDGAYSIIQSGTTTNATYTNPRWMGDTNDTVDTWTSPLVAYHIKVYGNNSWGAGDGTWQGGAPIGCDAVFFITGDGYANGICLYDFTGNYDGLYTWMTEYAFNLTDIPGGVTFFQSFTIDESNNLYDDNPSFNESYLFVGDVWGLFSQISVSDGMIGASINMSQTSLWSFCVDSPIYNTGRIYTLMHNLTTGMLRIQTFNKDLTTLWTLTYDTLSNTSGYWNPEPCLAFDTVFVTSHDFGIIDIWAQRDNEPPWVDCGESIIYPVIGQQYDLYNATAGDYDGYIANYTWDLEWGYRYTLDCNFTFWVHQSTTGYLNVTDDDDATASDSFTIIPSLPTPPDVNISWCGRVDILNNTEEFNGTNTTGLNLTYWNWSVEDPNGLFWYDNGTNQSINYTFTIWSDTYNVTLNVTDEWDQSDNQSVLVYIYIPDPPVANITWDEWVVVDIIEVFNGTTNTTGTNLTYWNWTVEHPNGTFSYDNGTNQTLSFTFTVVNETYNVTLNVTDEWSQSNNTTIGMFVNPTERPQFNWTRKPTSGYARDVLRYTFTSNNTTYVIWNWGDGSTSNTSDGNTTHTWSRWGTFTVRVTVWNDQGVSNTTTFTVKIGVMDLRPLQGYLIWFLILIVVIMIIKFVVSYFSSKNDSLDL